MKYKRVLDGEQLYRDYWLQDLSLSQLAANLPVNPQTGKPCTQDAANKAMWRWACRPEHWDQAFEIFKQSRIGHGELWTKALFQVELKEKGRWVLTPNQFRRWFNAGTPN